MSLLDIDIQDVSITREGLLGEGFDECIWYPNGDSCQVVGLGLFTKKIAYSNGTIYFDMHYIVDEAKDGWMIKISIQNHHIMVTIPGTRKWIKNQYCSKAVKPKYISDLQELQWMLTKEWQEAYLMELIKNKKLLFKGSETFKPSK